MYLLELASFGQCWTVLDSVGQCSALDTINTTPVNIVET